MLDASIHHALKHRMPIHYYTTEEGQNKQKRIIFYPLSFILIFNLNCFIFAFYKQGLSKNKIPLFHWHNLNNYFLKGIISVQATKINAHCHATHFHFEEKLGMPDMVYACWFTVDNMQLCIIAEYEIHILASNKRVELWTKTNEISSWHANPPLLIEN